MIYLIYVSSQEFLKKFGPEWYLKWFSKQPIEKVREYFGESLGIYFSFVGMPLLISLFIYY